MKASNQHASQTSAGGNQVGGVKAPRLHQPPKFLGEAGTPNPNSSSRGKVRS